MKANYNYRIFADAGIDIDSSFIKSGQINILPMNCFISDFTVECSGMEEESERKRIYDRQRNGELTSTTSLKRQDFEKMFDPLVKHGIGVLYISLSSQLSEVYNEALMAKNEMESKYGEIPMCVVNSLSATGGFGIIAEKAIQNKSFGMDLETNAKIISKMCGHVHSWFYVNDLEYLKRNGKTSATKSMIGTLLGIKPILELSSDGKLRQIDKKFGAKRACEVLKELYVENGGSDSDSTVYITHSDDYDSAFRLKKLVLASDSSVDVKIKMLSPVIGAHTGAGIIALHHYHS